MGRHRRKRLAGGQQGGRDGRGEIERQRATGCRPSGSGRRTAATGNGRRAVGQRATGCRAAGHGQRVDGPRAAGCRPSGSGPRATGCRPSGSGPRANPPWANRMPPRLASGRRHYFALARRRPAQDRGVARSDLRQGRNSGPRGARLSAPPHPSRHSPAPRPRLGRTRGSRRQRRQRRPSRSRPSGSPRPDRRSLRA